MRRAPTRTALATVAMLAGFLPAFADPVRVLEDFEHVPAAKVVGALTLAKSGAPTASIHLSSPGYDSRTDLKLGALPSDQVIWTWSRRLDLSSSVGLKLFARSSALIVLKVRLKGRAGSVYAKADVGSEWREIVIPFGGTLQAGRFDPASFTDLSIAQWNETGKPVDLEIDGLAGYGAVPSAGGTRIAFNIGEQCTAP